jgi:threonine dehydrogenase-like Zn-dependent dehydrogenase
MDGEGFGSGASIAVQGVGPMGLLHVFKARIMGAGDIIALDRSDFRLAMAKSFGADHAINTLEREGFAFASRDDVRKALIADHDGALRAFRSIRPAASGEPLRSRASAKSPDAAASAAGRDSEREKAIAAAAQTFNLKSRADAVARAQLERPDLWK